MGTGGMNEHITEHPPPAAVTAKQDDPARIRRAPKRRVMIQPTSMSPALPTTSTTCQNPPARCTPISASPTGRTARITSLDLDAVRACEGVVGGAHRPMTCRASTTSRRRGRNDEPVLATEKVLFYGQPVFAVIAETRELARRAAKKAVIGYEDLPHVTRRSRGAWMPITRWSPTR
jgi:hypothetical protein